MGNFQGGNRGGGFRGGNGGGKPAFQKKSWGNDRGGNAQMHKAVCSDCGKTCEVPFRPSGDKPVFCNDCFSGKREGGDDRGLRRDFDRAPKREFNDRPTLRPDAPRVAPVDDMLKKQITDMNTKLDRLISIMEKSQESKKEVVVSKAAVPLKVEVKKTPAKVVAKKAVPVKKVTVKKPVTKKKK
jgi:CxxC-x17-CxxC domain-containing protein